MRTRYTTEGASFLQQHQTAAQIHPHWNALMNFGLPCYEELKWGSGLEGYIGHVLTFQWRFCTQQSPLSIFLFSAWLTVHVGVLYNGQNPAGFHCNSFSGVFQNLFYWPHEISHDVQGVLRLIGPAWGWQLDGACLMKTSKTFKWLSFTNLLVFRVFLALTFPS